MIVCDFLNKVFNMDKKEMVTLANGKKVDKEWYENGWDDLKGDPRWRDFKREEPEYGQKIMCTYFKGYEPRQYEVITFSKDIECDLHITHWYPYGEIFD